MWRKFKLSEVGEVIGGSTPTTTVDQYYNGDIPWLTPKDLSGNKSRFVTRGSRSITQAGLKSCSARLLPKGTVLFSSRAPIGYIAIAQNELATNQGFKSIVPNEQIDSLFLYYLMKYNVDKVIAMASGTTFKEVSGQVMKNFEVSVPNLPEQKRIAAILTSLDDKIELNRKMNENLEQQAAALFKHWFVDFEFPDANGNPYRSSGGKMKDSLLGMIPEGWDISTLGQVASVVGGGTPSKAKQEYYCEEGIAWVTPKDLSLNKNKFISRGSIDITELGYSKSSAKLMPKGSILFSSRAPIGYIAITSNDICTNQGFKSIVPSAFCGTAFLYYYLKSNVKIIEAKSTGSTFKEVSGSLMKSIEIIAPSLNQLSHFETYCRYIFDMQSTLEDEMRKLSVLRDSLIIKLITPNS